MAPIAVSHAHAPGLVGPDSGPESLPSSLAIFDIRRNKVELSIREDMLRQLQPGEGKEKKMPTLLLYDEAGLKLFEDITFLDEYYLTNTEIEILQTWGIEMAKRIVPNSMIVELGSGNLRKTGILLHALEKLGRPCEYFALDLSLPELERTLAAVPTYKHVKTTGLHGTYDDGLEWLCRPENRSKPRCVVSLGSSIGNFSRPEAAQFLKGFAEALVPGKDVLLIGLDGCQDAERVHKAYNDKKGTTTKFILNGLVHANRILEAEVFKPADWEYLGEYDHEAGRHQAFYIPNRDILYKSVVIKQSEKVRVEESHKFSEEQAATLWADAGLVEVAKWGARSADQPYYVHMLVPRRT